QRDPDQGQPDRIAHGDAAVHRAGALQWLRRRHLSPLRRDRRHVYRRPRRGERGGADQDRLRLPHRPDRQVQPAAAHQRGAGRRRPLSRAGPVRLMTRPMLAGIGGAVVLVLVAVLAGEYSTVDWLKVRSQLAQERDSVESLRAQVDSLARVARALENDPATQERVAREQFGLIRNGEILYRIVPDR